MRSILQEAASVLKAIEKAWSEAGQPQEFSVKVFDVGERNFFGFSKRPAVISLLFDPRKNEKAQPTVYRRGDNKHQVAIQPGYAKRQKHEYQSRPDSYTSENHKEKQRLQEKEHKKHHAKPSYMKPEEVVEALAPVHQQVVEKESPKERMQQDNRMWPQDLRNDVKIWLQNLIEKMGISVPFTMRPEHHLLKIEFERPIFEGYNEERMIFSSFAYILMQFLKRKHKKRFRGSRLAIVSKR